MNETHPEIREKALQRLHHLESWNTKLSEPQILEVLAFLEHGNREVRLAAAEVLGHLGEIVKEYIPQIVTLLTNTDRYIHFAAIEALSRLGKVAKSCLPQILALLPHQNWEVRFDAAEVLGTLEIEEHIPQLEERGVEVIWSSPTAPTVIPLPTTSEPAPVVNVPEIVVPAPEVVVQPPVSEPAIPTGLLWAIIIIGAVLVIALIVLIVRTRRSV